MTILAKRLCYVLAIFLLLLLSAFSLEWLASYFIGLPFGHTDMGHTTGWIGLGIVSTVFIYSLKKRYRKDEWPMFWFWVHQAAGIIGPAVILVHVGMHFHAVVPVLALFSLCLVALSGVIGVFIHRKALSLLKQCRKPLVSEATTFAEKDDQLFELAASEKSFRIWQIVHTPMVFLFVTLTLAHIAGALFFGGL